MTIYAHVFVYYRIGKTLVVILHRDARLGADMLARRATTALRLVFVLKIHDNAILQCKYPSADWKFAPACILDYSILPVLQPSFHLVHEGFG